MRDPRAILAAQIALEKTRQLRRFSIYYCVSHWLKVATLAANRCGETDSRILVVPYEKLVLDPAQWMEKVCAFLQISFERKTVLTPTKAGKFWRGNSAAETDFSEISTEPLTRWETELSRDEIGWVEWHCRELMPLFGYEPRLSRRELRHWFRPIRYETPREYLKSRLYSYRDGFKSRHTR